MTINETAAIKVNLGRVFCTPGVTQELSPQDVQRALKRHIHGDWGDVGEDDWKENDLSLREGFRLLSSYKSERDVKFWVITEADRSATTVLLPSEY